MGDKNKENNSTHQEDTLDILIFLAQEKATEIRENKNHQRDVMYQFIFILSAGLGLFEIIKNYFKVYIPYYIFKLIAIICGLLTIYLLYKLQKSMAYQRKQLSKIWEQQPFAFVFEKKILERPTEKYDSFWYNFWEFTFIYILIIALVVIIVCFLK